MREMARIFDSRVDAGKRLAKALAAYQGRNALVLAIPRGAVEMGAEIARLLPGIDVRALALDDGKRAGELQASSATADVLDAHVALLAAPGDLLLTSDRGDLARLIAARAVSIDIVEV